MPIPDYQSLMRPLLELLADGKPRTMPDMHDELCQQFQLSADEMNERLQSGRQTVMKNRIGWARTYLNKAGLIEIPERGFSQITDRGREALVECPDRVDVKYLKKYQEFVEFHSVKPSGEKNDDNENDEQSDATPEEQLVTAYESINRTLASDILAIIRKASPGFFEQIVVDLMIAMGYGGSKKEAGQATQYTNDDGIDGIIKEDKLGLDEIYLQAKRWENTVHRPEIDKFIGSLTRKRAKKGVFITTSEYSSGAREAVENLDIKVVLIDGKQLAQLMVDNNLGVTQKETYEIKQLDSDYFSEES